MLTNHCNPFTTFDKQYVITLKKANESHYTVGRMGSIKECSMKIHSTIILDLIISLTNLYKEHSFLLVQSTSDSLVTVL